MLLTFKSLLLSSVERIDFCFALLCFGFRLAYIYKLVETSKSQRE